MILILVWNRLKENVVQDLIECHLPVRILIFYASSGNLWWFFGLQLSKRFSIDQRNELFLLLEGDDSGLIWLFCRFFLNFFYESLHIFFERE